jgi:hypothetical protein
LNNKAAIQAREVVEILADAPCRIGDIEKGERAFRAQNTAARARAKRPETQDEAVKNQMTARLADMDAKNALEVPEGSVKMTGEMMSPDFRRSLRHDYLVDTLENPSVVSVIASEHRLDLAACVDSHVAESAVDAAQSIQAENSLEKMLAHQMAAAHRIAMKMMGACVRVSNYPVENGPACECGGPHDAGIPRRSFDIAKASEWGEADGSSSARSGIGRRSGGDCRKY